MEQKNQSLFNLAVIVGALGYFVDIYDLLLFSIIRIPSLKSIGLSADDVARKGADIISTQMIGLLIGGILWGVLGDKLGRLLLFHRRRAWICAVAASCGSPGIGYVQEYAACVGEQG